MKPLIIAVDVDEVVAALIPEWLRRYNFDYDDNLTADEADRWELDEIVKPACGKRIFNYLKEPDLYDHVLPIPGARGAIYEMLATGHRIVYASSCPYETAAQKRAWLLRWGFLTPANVERDFLPVTDKSLIAADVLFDDRPENVEAFKGMGVLIRQPHNFHHRPPYTLASLKEAPFFLRYHSELPWDVLHTAA